ncbi:tetratricopeptide repeat protein [Campylobacter troglodytis]|uniref:tetratricopeptide repeat protein n=1 Tax=Campylobacter troglodytis TaxID=654363 RepID=UPI001158B393|nr:ATP-dependent nuclease subunit B [Campylobacter troglodytis]TQR59064.1 ATP-dependent nuclease subunit B [Campylobacter troglodytis]
MYRGLLLIALVLSACVVPQNNVLAYAPSYKQGEYQEFDSMIMRAYSYEKIGAFKEAREIFLQLFLRHKEPSLLENAFTLSLMNNLDRQNELKELAKPFLSQSAPLVRLSAIYHLQEGELKLARELLEGLIKWDQDFRNYEILADLYVQQKEFNLAFKHYKTSKTLLPENNYPNEIISLKIAELALLLNKQKEAKNELESFVNELNCTPRICILLGKIYSENNEHKKLQGLYIKLYESTNDKNFIRALLQTLSDEKKYQEALEIALSYDMDDEFILFLYQNLERLKEAYEYALKLYKQTGEKRYLLTAAVMEFEEASKQKKIDDLTLKSVAAKFEEGIDEKSEALFLNYYGYLLIDYNLDIKKGMSLVQRALKEEPNNLFYLDSLSWGYYKQGDCERAWDLMLSTMHDKDFANMQESKDHINAIKQCLSEDKR